MGGTRELEELLGVYDADGGIRGELTYVWGRWRGTAHCSLCDLTHTTWRRKQEWDALVARVPVPLRVAHRNELDLAEHRFEEYVYATVEASLRVSVENLDPDDRERYRELSAFLWESGVPGTAVARFWERRAGLTARRAQRVLVFLRQRSLVALDGDPEQYVVRLHELHRAYLGGDAQGTAVLAGELLESYRPAQRDAWWEAQDDGYLHAHLVRHLLDARGDLPADRAQPQMREQPAQPGGDLRDLGVDQPFQPLARAVAAVLQHALGQHDGVHRARAGAGDGLDVEAAVGQDLVEHAPGERAMRSAALQGERDALVGAPPRRALHVRRPSSRRRWRGWRR